MGRPPSPSVETLASVVLLMVTSTTIGQDEIAPAPAPGSVAFTAGDAPAIGVFEFRIVDADDTPIPGRLTFVGETEVEPNLFPNADARPDDLAVRRNVVYSLSGEGRITVPAGAYTVYASHGLEWSIDMQPIVLGEGETASWTARLVHEVDTTGWISGDFHLHTLTYSGHGDANMKERIVSIVAEGVEFAVATDHNHHTDYGPTIDHLHAGDALTAVTGNEVSVPVGHFNAFPLDPSHPPVDRTLRDANVLFRQLRDETNPFGVVPVIQVNHPRWSGIDYFNIAKLDPATGAGEASTYSGDFDTIEVFNENAGWGYYQAFVDDVPTSGNVQSVLQDWYNLLNRGHRSAAVGNSDSHTVHYAFAGYPRNFVRSATDDPAAIDPAAVARSLREREVFTTIGPFVEFTVNGQPMGGVVNAFGGEVEIAVRVQAASWIDCDRVKIVVNGEVVDVIDVPDTRAVVRLDTVRRLELDRDSWIAILVEGDDPIDPIVVGRTRPVRPLAVMNPVWVEVDEDDTWTSSWAWATATVARASSAAWLMPVIATVGPSDRGLLILAAAEQGRPFAADLAMRGLSDAQRIVRLRAARAAERLADESLASALETAVWHDSVDPYLQVALLRAIASIDKARFADTLVAYIRRDGPMLPGSYLDELIPLLPGDFVDDWFAVGYFDAPDLGTVTRTTFGPERNADIMRVYEGRDGSDARWSRVAADVAGFVSLLGLASGVPTDKSAACAQSWLYVRSDREVTVTLGTDDGSRVYLNGEIVYDNPARRSAHPFEHVATWQLHKGWNRVLFKVENGIGGFGLYLRVLDDSVTWAAVPEIGGIR